MVACMQCGAEMTIRHEDRPYADLSGVLLRGVEVRTCPSCGEYDISGTVMAVRQWQEMETEQRRAALNKAKDWAEPGKRPKIRTYLF